MSVNAEIKNSKAEKIEEIALDDSIYNLVPNQHVLYTVVRAYRANRRQGTHKTKTRAEVRASGRKIWMQKGLGRARHGSVAAPVFVGGSKAFGSRPRDYSVRINSKLKRLALKYALSDRVKSGSFSIIDKFEIDKPKTREMAAILRSLGLYGKKTLIVHSDEHNNVYLSARNIKGVKVVRATDVNALDILEREYILFDKQGLLNLSERLKQ